MHLQPFPFQTKDWAGIIKEEHNGISGKAYWQVFMMGDTRVRMVQYTAGYLADHWCKKGHVVLCLDGEMETELEDGRQFTLSAGMSYHVGDSCEAHRSSTKNGCRLFIVD